MYGVGTCVLGAVAAIIAVRQSKKVRERAEGAAV